MASILLKSFSSDQSRVVTYASILFIAVAVSTAIWLNLYDKNLLRSSVPIDAQNSAGPISSDSKLFSDVRVPVTFRYPASWQQNITSDASVTYVTLDSIQMWVHPTLPSAEELVAKEALGANEEHLMSYPGTLGSTKGTYWARASIFNDTQAPYGSRVYVVKTGSSTTVVLLPTPPFNEGQQRFAESFVLRGK